MTKKFTRREFLRACAAGAAGLGLASTPTGRAAGLGRSATTGVNVLLIIQDQLRYPAWFLDTDMLPGLGRLRSEGVWFTNHFTCAAPCSPSRATIQTGMHISQHGLKSNVSYASGSGGLSTTQRTLGHRFQAAGYRTPYFGKWHLSSASMLRARGNDLSGYGYEEWTVPDYAYEEPDGMADDPVIAGQAQDWLSKHGAEGPWFLTCSLVNPHDIMYCPKHCADGVSPPPVVTQLPPNFQDTLEEKPGAQAEFRRKRQRAYGLGQDSSDQEWLDFMARYCYYAQAADQQVSALLNTLDVTGLSENTLVIFTSDHGEMGGSHQMADKGPMIYQEVAKVPLALRWPSRLPPGQEIASLTHSVDIVPTLTDLVGLDAPSGVAGKSLKPLLGVTGFSAASLDGSGQTSAGRSAVNSLHSYVLMAYSASLPPRSGSDEPPRQVRAIFDGRHKYGLYFDSGVADEHELYDLESDPYELTNLADDPDHAKVRSRLADQLSRARHQEMGESS